LFSDLKPGTFVTLPLSQVPKTPREFFKYYYLSYKVWATDFLSMAIFKLKSMKTWRSRPQWQLRRSQIAPTATSLYRQVLEAFAAGDEKTLQRLCVGQFSSKLVSAIEKRSPQEVTKFELLKQTNTLHYLKLMTYRVTEISSLEEPLVEQAIVALSSRQKVWKEDKKGGNIIPGSLKFKDMLEYVVLSRATNTETWQTGQWRVWGTTTATTLEDYEADQKTIEESQKAKAGWDKKYPKKK
jgi:protein MBA1